MGIEQGAVLEGKVTGITKFGAFVALQDGKSGLVHISEVANAYVTDVNEYLKLGQPVKVLVMNVSADGKINLSIKRAEGGRPNGAPDEARSAVNRRPQPRSPQPRQDINIQRRQADPPSSNQAFEDRLKKFMEESDSRIADNRMYADHRQRTRRR